MTMQFKNGTFTSLFISVYIENRESTRITPIPNQLQRVHSTLLLFVFLNLFLPIVRKWVPPISKYQLIAWIIFGWNHFTISLSCPWPSLDALRSLLRPDTLLGAIPSSLTAHPHYLLRLRYPMPKLLHMAASSQHRPLPYPTLLVPI